jgi:hypothetical protein
VHESSRRRIASIAAGALLGLSGLAAGSTAVLTGILLVAPVVTYLGGVFLVIALLVLIVLAAREHSLARDALLHLRVAGLRGTTRTVSQLAQGATPSDLVALLVRRRKARASRRRRTATPSEVPQFVQEARAWAALASLASTERHAAPLFDPRAAILESGLFDTRWYQTQASALDLSVDGSDAIKHYLAVGWKLNLSPARGVWPADLAQVLNHSTSDPLAEFLRLRSASHPPRPTLGTQPLEDALRWSFVVSGVWGRSGVCVVRVVGNDLPPRHGSGQSVRSVRFILEHEVLPSGVVRRWVVNRITDPLVEAEVVALLEGAGEEFVRVPFVVEEYREVGLRFGDFVFSGLSWGGDMGLDEVAQVRAWDHVYGEKNRYVMNNNGARNVALAAWREEFRWVLPWDGNTFMTEAAWGELLGVLEEEPWRPVVVVPMARVTDNSSLLDPSFRPEAVEEPQLVFRSDVWVAFDESYRYGRRPKVELLLRLGVPGPWESWKADPWEQPLPPLGGNVGWRQAGWVARLASGVDVLESDIKLRGLGRAEAVRSHLHALDVRLLSERWDAGRLVVMDEESLEDRRSAWLAGDPVAVGMVSELVGVAEGVVGLAVPSVLDKVEVAPSGDRQDYFHPAPYWWPNPATVDGLPYVWRDGERVAGTEGEGGPGSERFDRWALQRVFDETFTLTLAAVFTGEGRFVRAAVDRVVTWFVDPATRMNPHLTYAQVRRGHDGDQGQATGIIEFSDVYYFLDAVRLLTGERLSLHLGVGEQERLRRWFVEYLGWLTHSPQGVKERAAPNNHGTWYDVQHVAIAAWLGDHEAVQDTIVRASERVVAQIREDGSQPAELKRAIPLHYATYNLAGWAHLNRMLQRLTGASDPIGANVRLDAAQAWLTRHAPVMAPAEPDFNLDRIRILTDDPYQPTQPTSIHWGIAPFFVMHSRDCSTRESVNR